MLHVKWREVEHITDAVLRHIIKEKVGGLAVRVYKADAVTCADILNGHILKKRGLPHAGLPDDIHVPRAVALLDAERNPFAARVGLAKVGDGFGSDVRLEGHDSIIRLLQAKKSWREFPSRTRKKLDQTTLPCRYSHTR